LAQQSTDCVLKVLGCLGVCGGLLRESTLRVSSLNEELKMKRKFFVLLLVGLLGVTSVGYAQSAIPFVGKRFFSLEDGNCNEHGITIDKQGNTKIWKGACSMSNFKPYTVYKGKFKPNIPFTFFYNGRDREVSLRVTNTTVALVDTKGDVVYSDSCGSYSEGRNNPCVAPLFKP
jgi:hypothetical protein